MSSLRGLYDVANEHEELFQQMTPANRRRNPASTFEQQMRIGANGIASVGQPTIAECHPTQFSKHSPFAMYAMEPSCGQFHRVSNTGLESGVSPLYFNGRCGPDPMANAHCMMSAYSRGFLPAQSTGPGIGRTTTPPLMVRPVRQVPPSGVGRLPPSMFPVQDPQGTSMSQPDRRMGAQMAYAACSGYRSMSHGGDQGTYPNQLGFNQFQMRNPQQMKVAQNGDPRTSSTGLQRMDSLTKRRQQQIQIRQNFQNVEISHNVEPMLPRGFHRNAGFGNQRAGETTYINIQQDVLPQQQDVLPQQQDLFSQQQDLFSQQQDLFLQQQDMISQQQDLLVDLQSRDPSLFYSSVPPEGGASVLQSELLTTKQVAKLKKQITVLLSKMEEYIRVCELASRRNNHSSASVFRKALIGIYSILDQAMRRDQWTAEFARSVVRFIKDSKAPMEGAQQIKQSLDSPLSNTTSAMNNHFLESDEIFNQDSQNLPEAVFQPRTEDSDFGMRVIEQNKTPMETDRLPIETPSHRQKVRKNKATDPGSNTTLQSSTQAQEPSRKVHSNQCLRNQSKRGSQGVPRESNRKRESRQETARLHQRSSKRRFDQSTDTPTSSNNFQETVKPKSKKQEITNTMKTVNGVSDGLDLDALDQLMDQTGDLDGSWLWSQIQNDFEEHHQEWKFDRKILKSISTSISELQSSSSLTNMTFLPDGAVQKAINQELATNSDSIMVEDTIMEDESSTTEVLAKIKTECDHLFNSLDYPGTFTYHTYIMEQSSECEEANETKKETFVIIECRHVSKICCDIKLVIGATYPETAPGISFSNASMDLGNQWLRTRFLSEVAELDLTSIGDILQLWIQLTTAEFNGVRKP